MNANGRESQPITNAELLLTRRAKAGRLVKLVVKNLLRSLGEGGCNSLEGTESLGIIPSFYPVTLWNDW